MLKKKIFITTPNLKKSTPFNSSQRHYKFISKKTLSKNNKLLKSFFFKIHNSYGKSSLNGHTSHKGIHRGAKKLYRKIFTSNCNFLGILLYNQYDPNRTSFISAIFDFLTFNFLFIPAIHNCGSGVIVGCIKPDYRYFKGFRYKLENQLLASHISLISLNFKKFAQYSRAAGTYCQLLFRSKKICKIKLPSGQIIALSSQCFATFGAISNIYHRFINIGKAGRNILYGKKPKVRGIAMNPVDHPHGGRTNGGCSWVTPWGKPFRFKKTSSSKIKKIYKLL